MKQVKLSEGGKIEVAKPTVAAAKVPAEIPQDDDEEEEEEGHTSFFLPASAAIKLDRGRFSSVLSEKQTCLMVNVFLPYVTCFLLDHSCID